MLIQKISLYKQTFNIPNFLIGILEDLKNSSYKPYFVGGCVRDFLLNKEIKDFDIEVFGLNSLEELRTILEKHTKVIEVGKTFGVLKIEENGIECDFSIPRVEKKVGKTHKSFEVKLFSDLSIKKAAKRRDFTINAIYYDYFKNSFIDPFLGLKDLKKRKIRYIDKKSFVEDSLRVFRAIGFASRFNFKITKKTKHLLKDIVKSDELDNLSRERVFEELKKLFLKSKKPSIGLKLLDELKIFKISFFGKYRAINRLSKILENREFEEKRALVLFFTILLRGEKEDEVLEFLSKISCDKKFLSSINSLLKESLEDDYISLKKQSLRVVLEDLILIELAFKNKNLSSIIKKCEEFDILNRALKPHIMGVDLLELGFSPSCDFRNMLNFALDLQIRENISKEEIKSSILKNFVK
ncbi:CCA tRNA nucleotidyltransferase [Aliarcobacter trophiarum]|uniref:CCA tRNA nucleotidyltransferase n=1 Tax=Aliarcobacter trophiarum TaxID=708186 RepID=UPI001D18BC82|nr:CCA tRNA nucleotidyltransferase [Aliarcobacter trophiarum]